MSDLLTLGLCSVSFRENSPEEIVKAAKCAGLSAIEWGSDIHCPPGDEARIREIQRLQSESGIGCSSYGTYFRIGESDLAELPGYIETARALGTRMLRLWCGRAPGSSMTEIEKERLFSECEKAAEIAESYGVTISLERHKKTFTESDDDAVRLMKRVGSEAFRMYYQPFQWRSGEENLKGAGALAPYTTNIHVFNWKGSEKLPLSGAIDEWKRYIGCFSGERALLLEFMPDGRIESLGKEADALRRIAGENR